MRIFRGIGVVVGIGIVIVLLRVWWASLPPKLPTDLSSSAIWVKTPTAPFSFVPMGFWVGCSLDAQRHVDRCRFADYKGKTVYESDYSTCDDRAPLLNDRLILKKGHQSIFFVSLQDGTILVQKGGCPGHSR
jgi:hypothetical protein